MDADGARRVSDAPPSTVACRVNGVGRGARTASDGAAARRAAREICRLTGHQGRLRRRRVRRLLGARRRRAGQQLPGAAAAGRGRGDHDDRRRRATGERLHAVQQAFIAHGGAQCGICTPGMILAAVTLLERTSEPTDAEIRDGARRQSVPLHRLHADLRGGAPGVREAAAMRSYLPQLSTCARPRT